MHLNDITMMLLLAIAVLCDQRERRIPNPLILTGLILGVGWNVYTGGMPGLIVSVKGLATGIALLFIPFAFKGMGAGDVKLLGMVGAFKGALFVLHTFVAMALWGGLIAVVLLIRKGQLVKTLRRLWLGLLLHLFKVQKFNKSVEYTSSGIRFPYALAIALGAVSIFFIN